MQQINSIQVQLLHESSNRHGRGGVLATVTDTAALASVSAGRVWGEA